MSFRPDGSLEEAIELLKGKGVEFPAEISEHDWGSVATFEEAPKAKGVPHLVAHTGGRNLEPQHPRQPVPLFPREAIQAESLRTTPTPPRRTTSPSPGATIALLSAVIGRLLSMQVQRGLPCQGLEGTLGLGLLR